MNTREIMENYLEVNGFDGLFNTGGECGCLSPILFPCGECFAECRPGYKAPCDCGDHDWHIVAEKPQPGGEA